MRATLINHRYFPFHGGSEIYIQRFAEWLASSGWQARVVTTDAFDLEYFWNATTRRVDAPESEVIRSVQVDRLPVDHGICSPFLFQGSRRAMGEASRVIGSAAPFRAVADRLPSIPQLEAALMARPRPDLMVGTNIGLEGLAIAGLRAARKMDIPFVFLPFAHLGDETDSNARRYVSMPHQQELLRESDLVVALTEYEAAYFVELGIPDHRLVVGGAGVELSLDEVPDAPGICSTDAPVVLTAGAMAREKGTIDLVEASRILNQRGVRHNLVMIGPMMSEFADWFESTGASELPWIHCLGIVPDSTKNHQFQCADVFALVSRTESFGIVYLEAWAAKIPVVGATSGAVANVISDGEDGILVPFGDPESVSNALKALLADSILRERLGAAGYSKVQSRYTWDKVFERIGAALERSLGMRIT